MKTFYGVFRPQYNPMDIVIHQVRVCRHYLQYLDGGLQLHILGLAQSPEQVTDAVGELGILVIGVAGIEAEQLDKVVPAQGVHDLLHRLLGFLVVDLLYQVDVSVVADFVPVKVLVAQVHQHRLVDAPPPLQLRALLGALQDAGEEGIVHVVDVLQLLPGQVLPAAGGVAQGLEHGGDPQKWFPPGQPLLAVHELVHFEELEAVVGGHLLELGVPQQRVLPVQEPQQQLQLIVADLEFLLLNHLHLGRVDPEDAVLEARGQQVHLLQRLVDVQGLAGQLVLLLQQEVLDLVHECLSHVRRLRVLLLHPVCTLRDDILFMISIMLSYDSGLKFCMTLVICSEW